MNARATLAAVSTAALAGLAIALFGPAWLGVVLVGLVSVVAFLISSAARIDARRQSIAARRAARSLGRPALHDAAREAGHLRAVIDRIDAPVLVLDSAGEVVLANASSATLLGRRTEGVIGRSLADLVTQSALLTICDRAMAGQPGCSRVAISIMGTPRTFDASAIPLQTDAEPCVVLTLRDVTDLATAGRLKTDFVANASHELRTPVAAIKGAVETLADALDDPHAADQQMRDRLVAIIARNARRLEDLLADLLELGRLEAQDSPPQREPTDVRALLQELAQAYELVCQNRSLTIEIEVDESVTQVNLNRRLIEVVLSNLIDNATRFAPEGSACTVRARRLDEPAGRARPGVRFEVTDRGIGIPLADQARIFERFYQVDHSRTKGGPGAGKGTGLGLSIVKHAVQLLGGRVGVDSILHQGSTFWVELPGVATDAGRLPAPASPQRSA